MVISKQLEDTIRHAVRQGHGWSQIVHLAVTTPCPEHAGMAVAELNEQAEGIYEDELAKLGKAHCNACDAHYPAGGRCPKCQAERERIAGRLAGILRDLADACDEAAKGDAVSKRLLEDHYSQGRGLAVAGRSSEIEALIWDTEENA